MKAVEEGGEGVHCPYLTMEQVQDLAWRVRDARDVQGDQDDRGEREAALDGRGRSEDRGHRQLQVVRLQHDGKSGDMKDTVLDNRVEDGKGGGAIDESQAWRNGIKVDYRDYA